MSTVEPTVPRTTGRSDLIAFALGVVAGSIAGLLLAPQAGRETRRHVADFSRHRRNELTRWTVAVGKFCARLGNKVSGSSGSTSFTAGREPQTNQETRKPPLRSS